MPVGLSIYLSTIYLTTHLLNPLIQPSIHPSSICIYMSILSVYHLFSIYLFIYHLSSSIYLLICLIHLSNHSFILHMYVFSCPAYLFIIHLSICLSIWTWFLKAAPGLCSLLRDSVHPHWTGSYAGIFYHKWYEGDILKHFLKISSLRIGSTSFGFKQCGRDNF